jgi:hypothetical protein
MEILKTMDAIEIKSEWHKNISLNFRYNTKTTCSERK